MTAAVVYRVHDKAGRLIYVGSTQDFAARWLAHERGTWWYGLVGSVATEEYPAVEAARAAEAVAIQEEQPAFNVTATGRWEGIATYDDISHAERYRAARLGSGVGCNLPQWIYKHEWWPAALTGARRRFHIELDECDTDGQALDVVLRAVENYIPLDAIHEALDAWRALRAEVAA